MTSRGVADLALAVRYGRTRLIRSVVSAPFAVQRALYLDDHIPDMAFVILANPGPGILQGDRLTISVEALPDSKAHITDQSASKVHAMPDYPATQDTTLTVGDRAYLEFLPEPVIPFEGARIGLATDVIVAAGGTLVYQEIIAPGRSAFEENLNYEYLQNLLRISRPNGRLMHQEAYRLQPRARSPRSSIVLGFTETPVFGSLLIVTSLVEAKTLRDVLRQVWVGERVKVGVSTLPLRCGVGIKVIGSRLHEVKSTLTTLASRARERILGFALPSCRKY